MQARDIALCLASVACVVSPTGATVVGGGGSPRTDCLIALDAEVNFRPDRPRHIRCTDGDATCDDDGVVNGVCEFAIGFCANSSFDPRCDVFGVQSVEVRYAEDNGDPRFDPDFQGLQSRIDNEIDPPTSDADVCTTRGIVRVPIRGPFPGNVCRKARKILRLTTVSLPGGGSPVRDKDKMKLTCDPAPNCDPQLLFAGTFDRIQRQVFNPSCAVSGCHDSETFAGGMTLEEGSAHLSLVDVSPVNAAATAAGYDRVTSGEPVNSFILYKLRGDLESGMGDRMPLGRRRISSFLIDILDLWIAAGAPETGWVPGTD